MKLHIWEVYENLRKHSDVVKIAQKTDTLHEQLRVFITSVVR
jgi:hypothetical protein